MFASLITRQSVLLSIWLSILSWTSICIGIVVIAAIYQIDMTLYFLGTCLDCISWALCD